MPSLEDSLKKIRKEYGNEAARKASEFENGPRLPSGIFEFDLITGGGYPRGRFTEIFGPESSGKTNLVLKAIALNQLLNPHEQNVFFDLEGTFDKKWAKTLGVDIERLIILDPDYAEQAVDMLHEILYNADDIGVIALDSLAAMLPMGEGERSAEKASVGGSGLAIGKMCRKAIFGLRHQRRHGRFPAILAVNQTRFKVGQTHGNPETTPGGNAPRFLSSLRVRVYGRNDMNAAISKTVPAMKHMSIILKKWKMPIVNESIELDMFMLPHKGMKPGDTKEWPALKARMEAYGLIEKTKAGYTICGAEYKTQAEFVARMQADPPFADELRRSIINIALQEETIAPQEDEEEVHEDA